MNRAIVVGSGLAALVAVALGGAPATAAPQAGGGFRDGVYLVQMVEDPAATYDGSIAGFAASRGKAGAKFDSTSAATVTYSRELTRRHDATLARVPGGQKLYDYTASYNGFAARLSGSQAQTLAKAPGVLVVTPAQTVTVDTSTTPHFLGLDAAGGLWDQLGGPAQAGEGVIIGDIDSGIWPEALSFSDRVGPDGRPAVQGKLAYHQIPGWHGKCTPGEDFNASMCNEKLIGAQYFNATQGGNAGIDTDRPWEFNSVRDYNGHGTHTASTAGGNYRTPVVGQAAALAPQGISGMAPRARIAAYKALWSTQDGSTASGSTADLVAAIDQAVADGVDVINYSVSGTSTNFLDPVEVAFFYAADAGVFVSASAGNSGPTASTVAHPSPWITTVAAGTHNRASTGSVTLGNGSTYTGASLNPSAVTAPLIDSSAAGRAGADPTQVALCYSSADGGNVLDPAKVAGKIVVCDRGVTARVNKSLAVKEAGGVGMILLNTSVNSLNADFHAVPTVHLQSPDRAAVKAYAATAGATATINPSTLTFSDPAPFTASFSSRGPLLAGGGDLLKPDLIAPGQDILAAVSPMTNHGDGFNLESGTSMSAPHVAGLAALLRDKYPTWSPMAIKSALMTSAYDVLDGPATNPSVIFSQGAGHVQPTVAAAPGLVYDSNRNDWLAFLCGTTSGVSAATCTALTNAGYRTDPSDANVPSIAIGDLAGSQTVTRRVTNVSGAARTFTAAVSGLSGATAVVSPASLSLAAGQTGSFTVTITRTTATLGAYVGGYLTWTAPGAAAVRSPIVVKPVALATPATLTATVGASTSYPVRFGFTGPFTATPRGLVAATVAPVTVSDDPGDSFSPVPSDNVKALPVTIPAGTTYARFATFDRPGSTDDVDLYLYRGTTLVGTSGNGGSTEEIDLINPTAGAYTLYVHGFSVAVPNTSVDTFTWLLDGSDAGNLAVSAPATATIGVTGTISVTPSASLGSGMWLGSIAYGGATPMPNPTIVRVVVP